MSQRSGLELLRLALLPGRYAVCRLGPASALPTGLPAAGFVSITRTPEELSVVCAEELSPPEARCERGWRCLGVRGPLPFSATGILSSLASPLADAGIPIFAVSTFDTDYLLVRDADLDRATHALRAAGHEVEVAPESRA